MCMTGSLEECMAKLYDLYVDGRILSDGVIRYLLLLKHENGEKVFNELHAEILLERLIKAKEELSEV